MMLAANPMDWVSRSWCWRVAVGLRPSGVWETLILSCWWGSSSIWVCGMGMEGAGISGKYPRHGLGWARGVQCFTTMNKHGYSEKSKVGFSCSGD